MENSNRFLRISFLIKKFLFLGSRFPAFKSEFIKDFIEKPETSEFELNQYRENCVETKRARAIKIVLVFILYSLKNLYLVYKQFQVFDYEYLDQNIKQIHYDELQLKQMNYSKPSETLKSISCLITNCTRLSKRQVLDSSDQILLINAPKWKLAEDASKLPLFMMCNQLLDKIYTPVDKLDAFGILAFLVSMYTVFLLGAWATIQQMLFPASDDVIMFIAAPKVTSKLVSERAREILCDLAVSYHNFGIHTICRSSRGNFQKFIQYYKLLTSEYAFSDFSIADKRHHFDVQQIDLNHKQLMKMSDDSTTKFTLDQELIIEQTNNLARDTMRRRKAFELGDNAGLLMPITGSHEFVEEMLEEKETDDELERRMQETNNVERITTVICQDPLVDSIARNTYFRNKSAQQISQSIENCLPSLRSDWWRPKLARLFVHSFVHSIFGISGVGLFSFGYIEYRRWAKINQLKDYQHQMEQSNCHIWMEDVKSFDSQRAIKVGELDLTWSPYAIFETATLNYLAGFSIAALFAHYWLFSREVALWLAELRMFIVASLLVIRLNNRHQYWLDQQIEQAKPVLVGSSNAAAKAEHNLLTNINNFYSIPNMRRIFRDSILVINMFLVQKIRHPTPRPSKLNNLRRKQSTNKSSLFNYSTINSKSNDMSYIRIILADTLEANFDADHTQEDDQSENENYRPQKDIFESKTVKRVCYNIETLEQIYINFRLFVEHVKKLRSSMKLVITLTYLLNYGYVLVAVVCRRKIADLTEEPMFIIVFGWTISNLLILISANFHANVSRSYFTKIQLTSMA